MGVKDGVLAYKFLKSANLSDQQQQLVKSTIDEMTYKNMVKKLNSIFLETADDAQKGRDTPLPCVVKTEPTYFSSHSNVRNEIGVGYDTSRSSGSRNRGGNYRSGGSSTRGSTNRGRNKRGGGMRKRNPIINGEQTVCHICGSWFHYKDGCPESYEA